MADASRLNIQAEEAFASAEGGLVADLRAEKDKLAWCDALVLQFPILWLGLPAILRGWIDLVFAVGRAYGGGRWFDNGVLKGKRAMCAVCVGGPTVAYSDEGLYAPIEFLLFPIHRGIFGFTGMTVIQPFVGYGPQRISATERAAYIARYYERLVTLDRGPTIPSPRMAE